MLTMRTGRKRRRRKRTRDKRRGDCEKGTRGADDIKNYRVLKKVDTTDFILCMTSEREQTMFSVYPISAKTQQQFGK